MISHEELKAMFAYDAETGILSRRTYRCGRAVIGAQVGWKDAKGYLRVRIGDRTYAVHRLAWFYVTGEWPKNQIDHHDLDKANNRFLNLRDATNAQNKCNQNVRADSETGIKGVSQDKRTGRYRAYIGIDGKRRSLGFFASKEEAAEARRTGQHHHGEFYRE